MYSYMTTLDVAAFNRQNIGGLEPGSNKYMDVLLLDPTHILTDLVVNYEMCEVGMIIDPGSVWGLAGSELGKHCGASSNGAAQGENGEAQFAMDT